MRNQQTLMYGLLASFFLGCATGEPARPASLLDRLRLFQGPTGPDVVVMHVALLEIPLGDPAISYINDEMWTMADERIDPMERRGVLEDNGFRIGQIGGITPPKLLTLLTSERSCANPRQKMLHAGNPATLVLGPSLAQARFQVVQDGASLPIALDQAQCTLVVVPTLTTDSKTRLRFTPQIVHGETALVFRSSADESAFPMLQEQRPTETYSGLSWEIAVAPNAYLLIGVGSDRPDTLGYQCFVRPAEARPVQRLLVIRTGRSLPGVATESAAGVPGEDDALSKSPPLAFQASWSAVRGKSP